MQYFSTNPDSRLTHTGRESFVYYGKQRKITLECRCMCGNIVWVIKPKFINGIAKSCGCLGREKIRWLNRTHGLTRTRTYRSYHGMKSRCYNPNFDGYADYGGRGITVAERWLESFESFLEDMGECPSNKHSIERVNNDGNYEPGNCKWATDIEQASNRRTNRYLEYQGRKYTVTSLARLVSIPRGTLNSWLNIYHYTDEQVINAIDQRLAA